METNGQQSQETYRPTGGPSDEYDQPAQTRILIKIFPGAHFGKRRNARFPQADNEEFYQTARMQSLI